ncbi:MAG: MFS transporter [Gammaproteobacteria bacterium]|nr:MFS transporter [Pseudomonadales bacterium]MCP5345400.1 MFS transporter [Pseudomonadales bacterium]
MNLFQKKAYALLTGDEDARVCRDIPDAACKEQPRNYLVHLAALALTKSGDKFIDPKITLAWLTAALGAPAALLSLLVPIHNAFSLLPQLVVAGYLRRVPVRKWLWCGGAMGQGLAVVGIALVAVYLTGDVAGWSIIGCLLIFSLSRGVCSVAHKDVLGKTVSKTRRGSVSGYADAAAGIVAIALAGWLMTGGGRNLNAVVGILLVAAGCWVLGALVFGRMAEQAGATEGGDNAIREALQQLSLLRTAGKFRRFVISRTLLLGTALLPPYLVVQIPSLDTGQTVGLGKLLLAASIAGFVSAPLWGRSADRSSRKTMILGATLSAMAGLFSVLMARLGTASELTLTLSLFVIYVGHAGVRLGRKTHLVDMASSGNRASYVAVSNTVIGVALLVLAAIGALVDNLFANGGLLFFSAMALGGALTSTRLQEEQQRP